ncbi:hypothetical protein FB451DRAFT_1018622 [Mycena latifolia]|nr:hypothetical protein FB451DRAFT_1018622 [Mycena latifolia]
MASPSAKRQRTENAPITRSDIWYQDGSVVFQAENTQFRVHWSVLAQHSTFFSGLQGLHQPPGEPTVDGCPIVELPDAAADVTHLLKVLYNPTFLLQEAIPFPVVAALVRLGRKYDFQDLFDKAVERLTFENPTTLEEYDLRPEPYRSARIVHYSGITFDMITLARENNIMTVLPCAYYRAVDRHTQIMDGIPNGATGSLALVDQRRCILGRETLMKIQFQQGYVFEWVRSKECDDSCMDPAKCTAWRTRILHRYLDFLQVRALSGQESSWEPSLCASCARHTRNSTAAGRKKTWQELPGFFDLPPWTELKNEP